MQIDNALLQRLENLSHLKISDDKREEIIGQLSEIVSFVDNLSELDTKDVDDAFAMTDNGTILREDKPHSQVQVNNDILENSPHSEDHFFIVPKIIE